MFDSWQGSSEYSLIINIWHMGKSPAFNFYSSDFLTGTLLMDMYERGCYITLICVQHQQGHLALEDMEKLCHGPIPLKVMKKYKQDDDGLYYNKKLHDVMAQKEAAAEKKRKNLEGYLAIPPKENKAKAEELRQKAEHPETHDNAIKPPPVDASTQNAEEISKETHRRPVNINPPTLKEVETYFLDHGFPIELAKRAWEGYDVNNWIDSQGKQIKNWKQKMVQVWFKEEHKIKIGIDRGQHPGQIVVSGKVNAEWRK